MGFLRKSRWQDLVAIFGSNSSISSAKKPIHRSVQYIFSSLRLGHECDITTGMALSGSLAFLRPGHAGGSAPPSCPCHYEQIPQATWLGPLRQPPVSWCLGPKICKSCSSWFHFPPPYHIRLIRVAVPSLFLKLFKKPLPPVVLNRLQFLDGLCKKRVIVWCNKIRCTSLVQTSFLWNFIFCFGSITWGMDVHNITFDIRRNTQQQIPDDLFNDS